MYYSNEAEVKITYIDIICQDLVHIYYLRNCSARFQTSYVCIYGDPQVRVFIFIT